MASVAELQTKYGEKRHAPLSDCPKCSGTGEWFDKLGSELRKPGIRSCLCIYLNHDSLKWLNRFLSRIGWT